MKRLLGTGIATLALVACGVQRQAPAPTAATALRAAARDDQPETRVDRARLEAALATLTGKKALPDGRFIKERGGTEGRDLTRNYLQATLEGLGYQVQRHAYSSRGQNVLATLPAESPTDETIIVGAHMDSVSNPGADDNGSGSAAVLEAAAVLDDLAGRKVNITFAWFDQEELGLVGSYAWARDLRKQKANVSSVHTLDMVGWDSDDDRAIEIERPDGDLWDWYQHVNKTHKLDLPLYRTNSGATDHVAFRDEGFKSVGICEEWVNHDTTPHYHRRSDTFETIDLDYLAAVTKLTVAAVGDMARKLPAPPASVRVPHNRFPGRDRTFHRHGLELGTH
ncbi:MAG: M28 family peptidase [Candidatus Sericytochromatia bacterium]|nr:M28 family peptidase [Candidatus Tanganyikabacteria bacterium]